MPIRQKAEGPDFFHGGAFCCEQEMALMTPVSQQKEPSDSSRQELHLPQRIVLCQDDAFSNKYANNVHPDIPTLIAVTGAATDSVAKKFASEYPPIATRVIPLQPR